MCAILILLLTYLLTYLLTSLPLFCAYCSTQASKVTMNVYRTIAQRSLAFSNASSDATKMMSPCCYYGDHTAAAAAAAEIVAVAAVVVV